MAQSPELKTNPLPRAIDTLRPAVVQIFYKLDQFPEQTARALGTPFIYGSMGTGFIVRDG